MIKRTCSLLVILGMIVFNSVVAGVSKLHILAHNDSLALEQTLRDINGSEQSKIKAIAKIDKMMRSLLNFKVELSSKASEYIADDRPIETVYMHQLEDAVEITFRYLSNLESLAKTYEGNENQHAAFFIDILKFNIASFFYGSFYQDKILRRATKDIISTTSYRKILKELIKDSLSRSKRHRIEYYVKNHQRPLNDFRLHIPREAELERSYSSFHISDLFAKIKGSATGVLSAGFGNFMGSIRFRKGYLYNNPQATQTVQSYLQPLDIILFKYKFNVTDKLIPGYFSHAALYIGNERQLKDLGLWNDPIIKPHQSEIKRGKTVIEALRPGLEKHSLEFVLNADEVAILRANNFHNRESQLRTFQKALEQDGSKYDFNFNLMTTRSMVCSELIRYAFPQVSFPYKARAGRFTMAPDHIGVLIYYDNSPLEFVSYIIGNKDKSIHVDLNSDSLLDHLGFIKKNGQYYEEGKVCTYTRKRRTYAERKHGGGMYKTIKSCKTTYHAKTHTNP